MSTAHVSSLRLILLLLADADIVTDADAANDADSPSIFAPHRRKCSRHFCLQDRYIRGVGPSLPEECATIDVPTCARALSRQLIEHNHVLWKPPGLPPGVVHTNPVRAKRTLTTQKP
jgi:hypothetical protein